MVNIYSLTGELLASAPIASDAVIREELMTADEVRLSWNSESGDELPLGAYIEINEERYSLLEPYCPEWIDAMFYKYEPVFQSRVMAWQRMPIPIYTYEDDMATIKSREFDWEFLGAPEDAMFIIAQAIFNETGERWDYEVAEGLKETVSITAQNTNVFAVLADVAEQCETEWWVDKDNNVLHLSRCERYSELPLEVGVNVSAPSVTNDREDYFTRFYALGSTKNMSNETGSSAVAQIINKRLTLDPKKYPQGYKDIKGHFENGVYVSELRQGEILPTTLVFDDVFPSSNLKISGARPRLKYRVDDAGEIIVKENGQYEYYAIWYFRLNDFQFSTDLILEGKNLSVAFKTGKLAGREFELKYHDRRNVEQYKDDVYAFVVDEGDYEIIIDESEGVILPMVDYVIPEDGDEVVLFNINMPNEYTQSAYLELEKELDKEIEKRLRNNNNYEFESYPAAFRDSALSLEVGRRVVFKYNGVEFHSRVISVEKQLDCEYQQKIRIGNQKISGTRAQMREEIRNVSEEVYAMDKTQRISLSLQRNYAQSLRNTIANYYALKDTIDMLQGAFDGFSEGINPVSVETMLLMLGDNSLQFRIFSDIDSLVPLVNPVVYDDATKHLHVAESGIVHYTLGVNDIQPSSSRDLSGYLRWAMDAYDSGELIEPEAKYYLYARVSKTKQEGEYELTTAKRELSEGGNYNLLVGILNAEYGGSRSFVPLYGYTAITGGQISTDVIRSSDGNLVIDLVNAIIEAKNGATIKGSVKIEDGSLLSSLLAVGEEGTDNVEAFLNGSDFARIENHYGKLILASGIPEVAESGSTKLEDRAKEARTRVYENGVLSSDYVFLDKGFLGQFFADTSKLKANSTYDDNDLSLLVFSLANKSGATSGLGFRNISSKDGVDTQVSIGSRTGQTQYDIVNKDKEVVGNMVIGYKHGLSSIIESNGSQQYDRLAALHVSCSGTSAKKNYAIYCPKGQVAGLRPSTRRVNSTAGTTLDEFDHTILCQRGNGTIPITLPTNKEDGQCYEIWKWGACGLRITAKNNIARLGVTSSTTQEIGAEWTGVIKLVYSEYDSAWLMTLCKTE